MATTTSHGFTATQHTQPSTIILQLQYWAMRHRQRQINDTIIHTELKLYVGIYYCTNMTAILHMQVTQPIYYIGTQTQHFCTTNCNTYFPCYYQICNRNMYSHQIRHKCQIFDTYMEDVNTCILHSVSLNAGPVANGKWTLPTGKWFSKILTKFGKCQSGKKAENLKKKTLLFFSKSI